MYRKNWIQEFQGFGQFDPIKVSYLRDTYKEQDSKYI